MDYGLWTFDCSVHALRVWPEQSERSTTQLKVDGARVPPLDKLAHALGEELESLREHDLLRALHPIEAFRDATARIGGRWVVVWCTNDYLGLARHPRVVEAACEATRRWGVGSCASRLVAGSLTLHAQLEERLASFFHTEAAVLFSSGYLANLGALSALLRRGDLVLADRLAHASLIDACRTSGATFRIFHHNDASHVARLLERYPSGRRRFVVTEGVFSMEGDRAPLRQLLDVAQTYGAFLYVDDAHGAFVTGSSGRGSPEAAGVPHARLIYMGTLGKALGCQGGFVAGPQPLIGSLHNRARQFIYSTALAVPVAAAALEALRLVEADGRPRARLARHVERLHARLSAMQTISALGQLRDRPASHIVPIVVGSSKHACQVSSRLMDRGIFAPAIRPPTVPEGTARLRISLTALHTSAQLNQLADALQDALLVDGNGTRHAARHLRHGN